MTNLRMKLAILVPIITSFCLAPVPARAQQVQSVIQGSSSYQTQRFVPVITPYPQVSSVYYQRGIGPGSSASNVVIVKTQTSLSPIIVVSPNSTGTIVVTPNSGVSTVIINTVETRQLNIAAPRQCSSAVFGSPISSPIPVDLNGRACF